MKYTQRENTILLKALPWLCERLAEREGVVCTRCWMECPLASSTRKGRLRCDAVIAGLRLDGSVYTVAVEAKSMRTYPQLRGSIGCVAQFLLAIFAGLVAAAVVGTWLGATWGVVLAVVAGILLTLAVFRMLTSTRLFFNPAAAIGQLRGYPGNERWLVVARDALQRCDITLSDLVADCSAAGVGLLEVGRKLTPMVHVEAVRYKERGDKILYYRRGHVMVETLTATSQRSSFSGMSCEHQNKL
jgi:hypothetical protein